MARKLIYRNNLGAELELTNTAPFLLQKFDPSENVNIYTNKGMNQDGKSYLGNTLDIQNITLQIAILANTQEELIKLRNRIQKIFNPKFEEGWLIYKDDIKERKVKCIVSQLPHFAKQNIKMEQCLIHLTCSNPFWLDIYEVKEEIALWKGDFEFGLEFGDEGIEFGHREENLIVNVNNAGDVECGMRIEFKALGTLKDPSLFNVNTREYIKINKTMSAGEVISINTGFRNKKAELYKNGITTNAFNYIDLLNSTFLQLNVGDNLFRYDADSNIDNLEVSIYYTPMYLGV
ncbi:MAG: phage tail family protein [Vallitalea sp.]|nr:phage tail family protein [Vallitalea sp.]